MLKPANAENYLQTTNVIVLWREMAWLSQVINQVICSYLKQEGHERHWLDIPPPELVKGAPYADLVTDWQLSIFERLGLALAMAPSVKPDTLDIFFGLNSLTDRPFTEFGGVSDKAFSGFIPTGQTLNFLISANNPDWRIYTQEIFSNKHRLMAEQVTQLLSVDDGVPKWAGVYRLNEEWLHYFMTGQRLRPELSASFPAHILESPLEWHDLVLDPEVMAQVEELHAWLNYGHKLMEEWQLAKKVKPGYRAVFFGPPGTGKTLTAALLGKATGREVYRVDLSMVVSKYIGETEKNLSRVFEAASYKEWILFFDEGDALFGKRSEVSSSNDRHANQLTGYLLQK